MNHSFPHQTHYNLPFFFAPTSKICELDKQIITITVEDGCKMSPRPEYLRLRRLLHDSLHRFSDLTPYPLTQEIEKDLLIALSQIFRQVKQLIDEVDSDEEELLEDTACEGECLIDATAQLDNRHCLVTIIGDLMFLLAVNSQHAQHLVGNTLVAISEFLLASDGDWNDFMQLLCLCLDLSICNVLKSPSISALETRYLDFNTSTRSSLKLKLKTANWSAVAAISRVIRNIQKCLKQDFDEKYVKTYLDSVSSLLINLPWDLLREIYVGHNPECLNGREENVLKINVSQLREMTTFFGHCIQLLCSLVTQSSSLEGELGFSPIIWRIINLVPKLTLWCQVEVQSPSHVRMSHYFRHKVLMLMVKLSCTIRTGQTISYTWMHLLHKYFEDLLLHPISGGKLDRDGFLEGSPFCTSIFDAEQQNFPSSHLQRLAILLFLKCSLNLVGTRGVPDEQQCMHENLKLISSSHLNLDSRSCSDSIGLKELHKWLQSHVHADIILNDELYFERCVRFTLSFIQLFMHEDDILFEMLLQLFHVPFFQEREIIEDEPLAEVKNHLAADLFNPIHLFHLFLAEISYDHQVLLDYLISKDTGSSCAEYLLRSLRIICNSWSLFVEFPGVKDDSGQLCVKRRKVLADSRDIKGVTYLASLKESGIPSLETERNEDHAYVNKSSTNFKLPFVAVRDCLASLTTSVDSLNRKGLFPYNPQVLLRRLMKFEELCFQQ
ncbi:uncharacterized protein LOC130989894 isoform X2 [Salvia miltiorrhiza]|uniref:uncharacterized protein LOC130989894 isoform X2 n=1 Tax=Salvia miltiorrhiza TaxID=226208 RepID=UPI0025AC8EF4|nr:uncharacterized protein LOC130989894 isoform X2 [Salvia miltiorrhiza]